MKSFEDPEKLFKRKNKEKLDFPLFGPSSSQDPHINPEWEVDTAKNLLRTKYESDLKNTEFNPRRLESYLLDSLWRDLQQTTKVETFTSHNTQSSLVPVNPPRPMATKFAPLRLPSLLHDLPQNYSQRISLFDGEGDITAKQHVAKFEDFIDLEEVDYLDVKMWLFAQSLSSEAKKWFKDLPNGSIMNFQDFQNVFLDRWDYKQNPLQLLSLYNSYF